MDPLRYEIIFNVDAAGALKLLRAAKQSELKPATIWDHGRSAAETLVSIEPDDAVPIIEGQG